MPCQKKSVVLFVAEQVKIRMNYCRQYPIAWFAMAKDRLRLKHQQRNVFFVEAQGKIHLGLGLLVLYVTAKGTITVKATYPVPNVKEQENRLMAYLAHAAMA